MTLANQRARRQARPMTTLASRPLGRSGMTVSTLGFGGAPLGDLFARLPETEAIATVEAAVEAGVTLIDTSPHYGNGLSEHRIGAALRRTGGEAVRLSTKVGRVMEPLWPQAGGGGQGGPGFAGGLPHPQRFDYSRDGAMRSLEQSLLRLGTDRVDILLIHDVDRWTHRDAFEDRFREAMAGAYRALADLRAAGVIRAIGVGVNEADTAARFLREGDFDCLLLAGRYSLLEQPALADCLPLAESRGVGVLLGGVFNSGILATGPVPGARYNYRAAPPEVLARVADIERVCAAHSVPMRRAALAFALGHPAVASLVMGAVRPEEVRQQAADLAAPVPPALWSDLKASGLLDREAPVPA
jgi:D-threo-aldose 1-dehydrogenase